MVKPCAEEIIRTLLERNPDRKHPRLYAYSEDFDRIRAGIQRSPMLADWYRPYKLTADYVLMLPTPVWELRDNIRLLHVSQEETFRMYALCLAYQVEQDDRYAARCLQELEALNAFPDFNPSHYLDVAQMTYAVCVAYDWCYHYFTEEQRAMILNMIVEKCMKPYETCYRNFASGRQLQGGKDLGSWTRTGGNWNYWCNGAAMAAAIVTGDEVEQLAGFLAEQSLQSLQEALGAYAPDGGFVEGVTYGKAAHSYWAQMTTSMLTAFGTDFGRLEAPGLIEFAYFVIYMTGTVTGFNYHDAGDNPKQHFEYPNSFFIANRCKEPMFRDMRLRSLEAGESQANLFDLIWYRAGEDGAEAAQMPLDRYFRKVENGTFRSSWTDPDAIWMAFHGGENDVAHTHLDSGSFVIDAMGMNWAMDLGTEPLTYFGTREQMGGNHLLLYRLAPDGHNTLVIDPSETEEGQAIPSFCPITAFESAKSGGYAIMDLTPAYTRQPEGQVWDLHSRMVGVPRAYLRTRVNYAHRGFALADNRTRILIQDELEPVQESEVWWSMHTPAQIQVSEDGKSAVLSQGGKRLLARLVTPGHEEAVFQALKAEPLPGAYQNPNQVVNTGIQKLAVCIRTELPVQLCVQLTCVHGEEDLLREAREYVPLEQWGEKMI